MAPTTGEPRQAPKPQPLGNLPLIFLFTTCTLCAVFILWRRASSLRTVVAHQLNTWTRKEGRIRLSEDDGPPVHEFLQDDYDEDNERLADDEPLAITAERLRMANVENTVVQEGADPLQLTESISHPPSPPPKT
ncbi:hypothetical protein AcW1_002311 [Taiwanofungus camphoratus]|nr:hypothetical protein AcV5_010312 [Antrodia cinnamomea]KAI0944649.1 hypothetical protein AcW1_002311 [Antrodia cinnamomea]KAI0946299.1 hypothetical protein AcV7_010312 [Antrodia cinnamomea]